MPKPSDDLPAVAQHWCVLLPFTAVDTRTNLRFDARTCTLMITPEYLDWLDERAASLGAGVPGKLLESDIRGFEGELRALIDAGLVSCKSKP